MIVRRYLTVFSRKNEKYIKEIELDFFNLKEMQNLFQIDQENPMYDCYEVNEKGAAYFKDKYGIDLDLKKYFYYVECESIN